MDKSCPATDWLRLAPQYLDSFLTKRQIEQFERYLRDLLEWNAKFNLTAIRDPEEIRIKHFLDSLTVVKASGDLNGKTLVDVGTGAGFPGIPLKIAFPELELTLIDSVGKKLKFCEHVCASFGWTNVIIRHARVEDAGHDAALRESYDFAVARAVTQLPALCEYLMPFIKIGGKMIAQKSAACDPEIAASRVAIAALGGQFHSKITVSIPIESDENAGERALIVIQKNTPTPKLYPRQPGTPTRKPLS